MVSPANLPKEFSRIAQYFAPLTADEPGAFGLQNDAAALSAPAGKQIVITSDSCIEGWHVPRHAVMGNIATKLVRRNLSDLAAMGATPWRYLINLHLPHHVSDDAVAEFVAALKTEQESYGMVLIGGDSTFGGDHVHASMTLLGLASQVHSRSGARVGDDVYVSGIIGEGALALMVLEGKLTLSVTDAEPLWQRYYAPVPRLALGQALQAIATSVIDVSDGLINDLAHLARASQNSILLDTSLVPLHPFAARMLAQHGDTLFNGGDDYELAFTAPADAANALQHIAQQLELPITKIGVVAEAHEAPVMLR